MKKFLIKLLGGYTYEEKETARNEGHESGQLYCAVRIKEFMNGCKNKNELVWLYVNTVISELRKSDKK